MPDPVWLYRRRRFSVPTSRCDICRGEGLLELAPTAEGRWACPVCRYEREPRREAASNAQNPSNTAEKTTGPAPTGRPGKEKQ